MSDELLDSEERMKNLQILDPKVRIAIILIKSIDVFGFDKNEKTKLSFTLSRYDIANLAGTTYETVIRTLAHFSKEKIIILDGKEICINKEKELRKFAGQTEEKVNNESDKKKHSRKKSK
jgi:CRP/FNR family transcriptional regulator